MKSFNCPDCKLPIVTADVKAKLCKCDFKRLKLDKFNPNNQVPQAKEVYELIYNLAQKESYEEWAKK